MDSRTISVRLPIELHRALTRRAANDGVSLAELVRQACREWIAFAAQAERRRAVHDLLALDLPVADPRRMKTESVPRVEEALPERTERADLEEGRG